MMAIRPVIKMFNNIAVEDEYPATRKIPKIYAPMP
jgi:hypothetical protein